MSDLGSLLERASHGVELGPDAFEGLLRRRERKQRAQRLEAAALAFAIVLALGLAALEEWLTATEPQPASTGITSGTVGDLETLWTAEVGGTVSPPAVADGVVVTVNERGHVVAVAAGCRSDGDVCDPLWTAEVGPVPTRDDRDFTVPGWIGTPGLENEGGIAIQDGAVFVPARDGTLSVFATTCRGDGGTCEPWWRADLGTPMGLPQVVDDVVLAPTDGGLLAFDMGCASEGGTCDPTWRAGGTFVRVQDGAVYVTDPDRGVVSQLDPETGQAIWSVEVGRCESNGGPTPVRFGNTVYVDCGRQLFALPADCRGTCQPTWVGDVPDLFSDGPVVAGGAVVLSVATDTTQGGLLAFPVDCATGGDTCAQGRRTTVPYELTTFPPVVADGVVITVSGRASAVFAFDPACLLARDDCPALWSAFLLAPDQPAPTHDVVFLSDTSLGTLQAIPARCPDAEPPQTEGELGTCPPLWSADLALTGSVVVAGEQVFATGQDGVLYAFGLPDDAASTSTSSPDRGRLWPVAVVFAIALLVVTWQVRRTRGTGSGAP